MLAQTEAANLFAFDNSYARLPDRFFARLPPTPVAAPRLLRDIDQRRGHQITSSVQAASVTTTSVLTDQN